MYNMTFDSPFSDYLLLAQANPYNCICNTASLSYCMNLTTTDWVNLHSYYRDSIAPNI